jgi:hypothetical protein
MNMNFKDMLKHQEFFLWIMFACILAIRLFIVFSNTNFNYDAYFTLRQVENIQSRGTPIYQDDLSYGGKTLLFAPLYYYIIAFFGMIIGNDAAGKIIPNVFAALIVIVAYLIAMKITKSHKISMITGFMTGFVPIMFFDINNISLDYFAIILIFSIIYCIMKFSERRFVDYALILIFMLVLTTPLAFILILGLLIYLLLLKLENFSTEMKELEVILFFIFLVFWINLLIYKNALLSHGISIVWNNLPLPILANFFGRLTFLETFYTISIIPLILGIHSLYTVFYLEKNKDVMLLTGFAIGIFLLLWFKLIDLITGLSFLSVSLVLLSAFSLKRFAGFLDKSKFHRHSTKILWMMIILFVLTAILPSILIGRDFSGRTPTNDDINVLSWAKMNLPRNAVISASIEEGNMVSYYANRKNIMDTNFLLTPNINQRMDAIETIYKTRFETDAVRALNNYNSKYIFLSENDRHKYRISELFYTSNEDCFEIIYNSGPSELYLSKCKIK